MKTKELVNLREKKMKNGGSSLYLDYFHNGIRSYEFLHLYLLPGTDPVTRKTNTATMSRARLIKAERELAIQRGEIQTLNESNSRTLFADYYKEFREKKLKKGYQYYECQQRAINSWLKVFPGDIPIGDINKSHIKKYISYLESTGKKPQTVRSGVYSLSAALNDAEKEGIINRNPIKQITTDDIGASVTKEREYLTLEELKILIDTPSKNDVIKRAFLFSCFTGLRLSDIKGLRWDMIHGNQIEMRQKKTKSMVYIPMSDNARSWLPERKGELVFPNFPSWNHVALQRWVRKANLSKHISFHSARHTCATLLLTYGADLYTVSKILGHSNISTTQIYAKIVDEKKREAVDLIPKI